MIYYYIRKKHYIFNEIFILGGFMKDIKINPVVEKLITQEAKCRNMTVNDFVEELLCN